MAKTRFSDRELNNVTFMLVFSLRAPAGNWSEKARFKTGPFYFAELALRTTRCKVAIHANNYDVYICNSRIPYEPPHFFGIRRINRRCDDIQLSAVGEGYASTL